jgi:polyphosphate kinase
MCALRPGVPGLSEHIRVRSILGRFLEHSRLFRFCNDGDDELWLGSADMMHRNLDRRVEALIRVGDPAVRRGIVDLLDAMLSDDVTRWELGADGEWSRIVAGPDGRRLKDYQQRLVAAADRRAEANGS